MSDPNFYLCDKCNNKTNYRLYVPIEWIKCPAGGPSEEQCKILDLCGDCLFKIIKSQVGTMDTEQGKDFIKKFEAMKIDK